MIQKTSLDAYNSIQPELGYRQNTIYKIIRIYPNSSNHDISRISGIPINSVTPRVHELRDMGLVVYNGTKKDSSTNRTVMMWKVIK